MDYGPVQALLETTRNVFNTTPISQKNLLVKIISEYKGDDRKSKGQMYGQALWGWWEKRLRDMDRLASRPTVRLKQAAAAVSMTWKGPSQSQWYQEY